MPLPTEINPLSFKPLFFQGIFRENKRELIYTYILITKEMKVVTLIAALILIAGALVTFVPLLLEITQPTHSLSAGFNQMGDLFASTGLYSVAEAAYDGSLELESDNIDSLTDKADILVSSGKNLEALTLYSKVLNKTPDSISVTSKKLKLLKSMGKTEESKALQMKMASTSTSDPSDQMLVIRSLIASGNYTIALEKIDGLIKTQPNSANLWEMRGDAFFGMANSDQFLKNQMTSLETKGGLSSETAQNILKKNQAISEGVTSYRQALLYNPMQSAAISEKMFRGFNGFGVVIEMDEIMHDLE